MCVDVYIVYIYTDVGRVGWKSAALNSYLCYSFTFPTHTVRSGTLAFHILSTQYVHLPCIYDRYSNSNEFDDPPSILHNVLCGVLSHS